MRENPVVKRRVIGVAVALAGIAFAATPQRHRVEVDFTIEQETVFGQSVFVVGSLAELGGGEIAKGPKLVPSAYPEWTLGVSLPAGVEYTYRYYVRSDGPGAIGDAAGAVPVSGVLTGVTDPEADSAKKALVARTTMASPEVVWRYADAPGSAWAKVETVPVGAGRRQGERTVAARAFGREGRPIEFYLRGEGNAREPRSGAYRTHLDEVFVQDGRLFGYVPDDRVSGARRDDDLATPRTIESAILGETRRYRVLLPRGYDEHTDLSYPVIVLHDGQNMFEHGAFGTWDADDAIIEATRFGRMRETIAVAVDHTDRFRDFIPPSDGRRADGYARFLVEELLPEIRRTHRTLGGPEHTASAGSSLGGLVSMYHALDWPEHFGTAGVFSPALWIAPNFSAWIANGAMPEGARLYLDSGTAGTSDDGFANTIAARDALLTRANGRRLLEGTLRHVVGFGDQHNEAAWAARLPEALEFMCPANGSIVPAERGVRARYGGRTVDLNGDGRTDAEDMYEYFAGPEIDADFDGVGATAADAALVRDEVRKNESVLIGRVRPAD